MIHTFTSFLKIYKTTIVIAPFVSGCSCPHQLVSKYPDLVFAPSVASLASMTPTMLFFSLILSPFLQTLAGAGRKSRYAHTHPYPPHTHTHTHTIATRGYRGRLPEVLRSGTETGILWLGSKLPTTKPHRNIFLHLVFVTIIRLRPYWSIALNGLVDFFEPSTYIFLVHLLSSCFAEQLRCRDINKPIPAVNGDGKETSIKTQIHTHIHTIGFF